MYILCISTSEWALCMLFAGQNHIFGVKTFMHVFCYLFFALSLLFFRLWQKKTEKLVLMLINIIFTSEQHVEHPLPGQNTQQVYKFQCSVRPVWVTHLGVKFPWKHCLIRTWQFSVHFNTFTAWFRLILKGFEYFFCLLLHFRHARVANLHHRCSFCYSAPW